jgi:integrase
VLLICVKNGWLLRDPFINFNLAKREVERDFLTETELQAIIAREFSADRLNYIRDIFLFSCFTGLAFVDVKQLKRSEVGVGVHGEKWIFTKRQKTGTSSRIPLLPTCLAILDR